MLYNQKNKYIVYKLLFLIFIYSRFADESKYCL